MARTVLETPGEDVGVFGGQFDIYGTTSGGEEITILTGTDVWLDPSFNTGGDTIRLPGEAEDYTARVAGSYVILTSVVNDVTVEIPVGTAGITIVFGGDDSRTLMFDTVDGRVELDGEAIDSTADPLSPGSDGPTPGQVFNLSEGSQTTVGTEGDDSFRASNEELGSGDVILGLGGNDRLQVFVDQDAEDDFGVIELADGDIDYAGFETESVEQVLITNDSGFDVDVDLSGAEGVELVGSVNSSDDVQFNHVTSLADVLLQNLTIASGNDVEVFYRSGVTAGAADAVDVTIIDSSLDELTLGTIDNMGVQVNTGIETVNLTIDGDSTMNDLDTELTTLNIGGAGDLVIDNPLEDTVRTINATALDGDIDIDFSNNTVGVDYDGTVQDDTVNAGAGDDNISTGDGDDSVLANDGNDIVNLGSGDNYANGGNGNDTVTAGDGDDTVEAGAGNDTVSVGDGDNWVDAAAGNDTVTTGAGADIVYTGSGADTVSTGDGVDQVVVGGELGIEDFLNLGGGSDWLYVDAGTVDVDYTNVSNAENLVLTTAGTTVLAAQAQEAGIRTVFGHSGDDVINATAYTAPLIIYPSTGTDDIQTGSANDTFIFFAGQLTDADIMDANAGGGDVLDLRGSTTISAAAEIRDFEIINLAAGGDYSIETDAQYVSPPNGVLTVNGGGLGTLDDVVFVANAGDYSVDITTGGGADIIATSLGDYDDNVSSGGGDDIILTYDGDDDIMSGSGDDIVLAGIGDDDLHLGAGDDIGIGDVGADRFFGDLGADQLVMGVDADVDTVLYANVSESGFPGGRDTIAEFDSGEDQIDISELLANNGVSAANTEYIFGQDLDAAEAQMVAGDGIISYVYIETLPGEPTEVGMDGDGYFFVDINDDGELGGEDLQVFIVGDQVMAGDVVTGLNLAGESGYDVFADDLGIGSMAMIRMEDASFA